MTAQVGRGVALREAVSEGAIAGDSSARLVRAWDGVKALDMLRAELFGLAHDRLLKAKAARLVGFARAKWVFRGCQAGARLCALGDVRVHNRGRVVFGERVTFVGGMIPTSITVEAGGELLIGDETNINYATRFEVHQRIEVGARCLFASMIHLADKVGNRVAPIRIGDDCWVAHGAVIEPGVTVGRGSVVAAGAVVTRNVPEDSIALGNPARTMKLSTMVQERK